jgi:hypothetical protein
MGSSQSAIRTSAALRGASKHRSARRGSTPQGRALTCYGLPIAKTGRAPLRHSSPPASSMILFPPVLRAQTPSRVIPTRALLTSPPILAHRAGQHRLDVRRNGECERVRGYRGSGGVDLDDADRRFRRARNRGISGLPQGQRTRGLIVRPSRFKELGWTKPWGPRFAWPLILEPHFGRLALDREGRADRAGRQKRVPPHGPFDRL